MLPMELPKEGGFKDMTGPFAPTTARRGVSRAKSTQNGKGCSPLAPEGLAARSSGALAPLGAAARQPVGTSSIMRLDPAATDDAVDEDEEGPPRASLNTSCWLGSQLLLGSGNLYPFWGRASISLRKASAAVAAAAT